MFIGSLVLVLTYGIVRFPTYIYGLKLVILHSVIGHESYLFGTFSEAGFWYYYPIVFLIKTPLVTLFLIIVTFIFARKIKNKNENPYFIIIIAFFLLFTLINKINIGLRHILLIYPFIFLFCSKITKVKIKNIVVIIIAILYVATTINAHPHYLPFFNQFINPEEAYNYVIDSNIDWGQDLKGLKKYMVEKDIPKMKIAYFGLDSRYYRKIEWEKISCEPQTGLIAVSVNYLVGFKPEHHECLWWLRSSTPIDTIGHSIRLYNLSEQQVASFLETACFNDCQNKCEAINKEVSLSLYNQTCTCKCA